MQPPLRIAILEADTLLDEIVARDGTYGTLYSRLLKQGADALGQPDLLSSTKGLEFSAYDVVTKQEYPDIDSVDAILISGSKHNSWEDVPWILKLVEFTKKLLAQDRVRIIGVCFGHQILGRAAGAKVGRSDDGWEISVLPVELTAKGKEIFQQDTIRIHQMHRDIVHEYPEGSEKLGASPRCLVQGLYKKGRYISVQGHPEFNEGIITTLVTKRNEQGIFNDVQARDALERAPKPHDGVAVAKGFLRFLLED